MRKVLFILTLILGIQLLTFSCFCPCGCGGSKTPQKISILSLTVETVSQPYSVVDQNSKQPFDRVFKSLSIGSRQVASSTNMQLGNLLSAAYACSPAPLQAVQTFSSIEIVSASDFTLSDVNDIIKVGDDITNRFVAAQQSETNFKPIDDFIDQLIIYDYDRYMLRLKDKPGQETALDFHIIISMSDGNVFRLEDERLIVF